MTNNIKNYDELTFENIKHLDENGQEFWYARELQTVLEYTEWRNFTEVIDRAKIACKSAGNPENSIFVDVNKNVKVGFGERKIEDIKLSRYACYLIVQNGDPRAALMNDDIKKSCKGNSPYTIFTCLSSNAYPTVSA